MKQPRQLTARGKAPSASPNGQQRSSGVFTDAQGFVHAVGSMSTPPQNDAGICDTTPRWEERVNGVWVEASWQVQRSLKRLEGVHLKAYLFARQGLVRQAPVNDHGLDADGEYWECPRDYDLSLDRARALDKALKCGLLTLRGRTYRLKLLRSDTYAVVGARGTVNFTREALLDVIARGTL